ncbi:hypothetical protein BpHYR1_026995 [Brachionus plicatilis]|uniref:Uncharacterized protein n=1 Tax=Brachionus plicatilis TaxID=10195 RepID=A0A3M7SP71_BRAPC|nr:hypothetical protein BpHYR1_026995 [Brachionus plicatilis]
MENIVENVTGKDKSPKKSKKSQVKFRLYLTFWSKDLKNSNLRNNYKKILEKFCSNLFLSTSFNSVSFLSDVSFSFKLKLSDRSFLLVEREISKEVWSSLDVVATLLSSKLNVWQLQCLLSFSSSILSK